MLEGVLALSLTMQCGVQTFSAPEWLLSVLKVVTRRHQHPHTLKLQRLPDQALDTDVVLEQ